MNYSYKLDKRFKMFDMENTLQLYVSYLFHTDNDIYNEYKPLLIKHSKLLMRNVRKIKNNNIIKERTYILINNKITQQIQNIWRILLDLVWKKKITEDTTQYIEDNQIVKDKELVPFEEFRLSLGYTLKHVKSVVDKFESEK